MTGQGGGYGRESGDHTPPFPRQQASPPWQQPYQHPPVDPYAPVNYPDPRNSPYAGHQPPYGSYPPPPFPGPYDPYRGYLPPQTNNLAVASLITSIVGVIFGIPLAVFCFLGWFIPVIGATMGAIALGQIKRSGQQGRGMAIAGVAIGATTAALLVLVMLIFAAAIFHSPTLIH